MYITIINLGLKSVRAIVFDFEGNKIKTAALPVNTILNGVRVEQSPAEWLDKTNQVLKEVTQDKQIRENIKYFSVTTSSSCFVPIDSKGNATYNCMMVSDKRSKKESDLINASSWMKENGAAKNLSCNEALMLPKALWLKNNEPDSYHKTAKFVSPNDFLIHFLTGNIVTDPLNAEKFFYSSDDKSYPNVLLNEIGINSNLLPEVRDIGENVGSIKNTIAEQYGLHKNVEVIVSTYDAICAFWGSGGGKTGTTCEVSGTVTSLRMLLDTKTVRKNLFTQKSGVAGKYLLGGSNNLGGGLIEWTKQAFYAKEDYAYEVMEKEAKESTTGADGILFLPYLMGERAPLWNDEARGVFFGLERQHNRKDFTRAIFESAGFSVKTILEILETANLDLNQIRVSGGLTRVSFINQIKADIYNKEILVCDEFETTALGALMLVLISVNNEKMESLSAISKIREIILPNSKNVKVYQQVFELYKELYNSLLPLYKKRTTLVANIYDDLQDKIENL